MVLRPGTLNIRSLDALGCLIIDIKVWVLGPRASQRYEDLGHILGFVGLCSKTAVLFGLWTEATTATVVSLRIFFIKIAIRSYQKQCFLIHIAIRGIIKNSVLVIGLGGLKASGAVFPGLAS